MWGNYCGNQGAIMQHTREEQVKEAWVLMRLKDFISQRTHEIKLIKLYKSKSKWHLPFIKEAWVLMRLKDFNLNISRTNLIKILLEVEYFNITQTIT